MALIFCIFPLKKNSFLNVFFSARLDCRETLGRFDNSGRDHHQDLSISGFIEIHCWTMCRFLWNIFPAGSLWICWFIWRWHVNYLHISTRFLKPAESFRHFHSWKKIKSFSSSSIQDPNILQSCQVAGCSGTKVSNFWRRCLEAWYLFELLHYQVDFGKGALEVGDKLSHFSAGQIWKKEIRHLLVGFPTDENLDVTSTRLTLSLLTFSLWPSRSP